jgi:hypothetical protein
MLDILFILGVLFIILTFFYKQAVCEFRINQIEWSQNDQLVELLGEKIPLVLRSLPSTTCWSHNDVIARSCYSTIPLFQEMEFTDWISSSTTSSICPWKYKQAEQLALLSGIHVWANKWLNPLLIRPYLKWWLFPRYHCWAGNVGLRKSFATWTCIFPVDGEILVTIMPESMESMLPTPWMDCFPSQLTKKDTPFVEDIRYIDIVLRPGTSLFIPAHWFFSWSAVATSEITPMVCTISYHSPISLLAFNASPYTK